MRRIILTCALVSILGVPATAQEGIKRTPLGTIDGPPGYQIIMGYAELSVPNGCAERHTHFGTENSYVVEGEFIMKVDGQPDRLMKAGDAFQIPAGAVHTGCLGGSGGGKVLTVHVVEKGKPLSTLVK
jgi:uncharacterized cupin superfamily protein